MPGTLLVAAAQALTAALHTSLVGNPLASAALHAASLAHPTHHQLLKSSGDLHQLVSVQRVVSVRVELLQQLLGGRVYRVSVSRSWIALIAILPLLLALPCLLCRPFGDLPRGPESQPQAYDDGGLTHGSLLVPISSR
jgi:hypothetical protein